MGSPLEQPLEQGKKQIKTAPKMDIVREEKSLETLNFRAFSCNRCDRI